MTVSLLILFTVLCLATITKFVLAARWRTKFKLLILASVLILPPAITWWMTFTSPGSGWGFGLIAFALSAVSGSGGLIGCFCHSLSH